MKIQVFGKKCNNNLVYIVSRKEPPYQSNQGYVYKLNADGWNWTKTTREAMRVAVGPLKIWYSYQTGLSDPDPQYKIYGAPHASFDGDLTFTEIASTGYKIGVNKRDEDKVTVIGSDGLMKTWTGSGSSLE